jgi:hypothetical protein
MEANNAVWRHFLFDYVPSSLRSVEPTALPFASNLWVVRGKAYDLTPWLHQHPGGSLILEQVSPN